MKRSVLALSSLALIALLSPPPALAAPIATAPEVSSHALPTTEDTVVDTAFTTLQDQIVFQEKLAQAKIVGEKKAAEEQAAAVVKAREDRNTLIKKNLGVTADKPESGTAFSLLTEEDLVNLSKTPCTTDEKVNYSNGQLPLTALCALSAKPHSLRPHAAVAFDALSSAFEREFKTPLCITDSYRTKVEGTETYVSGKAGH